MKLYALAKKQSMTYGHGDFGTEYHICPINAYMGGKEYPPLFKTREAVEIYCKKLLDEKHECLIPVEMEVL